MPRSFDSVFYGAAGGVDLPSDDEFNRVSFLSHFDGANNGVNNVFDDGSANNYTVTAAGNVTQGSFGPFARPDGEWGVDLPANGDTINLGSSTDFNFAGDFSIEMFIMDNSTDGIIFSSHKQGDASGYYMYNRPLRWDMFNAGNGFNLGNDNNPPVGVWYHFVISRQSGSMRGFIDGVLKAVVSNSSTINSSAYDFMIGGASNSSGNLDFTPAAKVSNFRIVNGSCPTAYQTSSTTVGATIFAVPTGKLTAVTNTKLLTCQSNRFVDNSASAHTATPTGNVAISAFGPFLTDAVYDPAVNGASAYMDGTGDYLSMDGPGTLGASANWCMECFFYCNDRDPGIARIMSVNEATDADAFTVMRISNNSKYEFYSGGGSSYAYSNKIGAANFNEWTHIAMTKSGTTVRAFVNGIKLWEATHNATNVIAKLITGWGYGSEYFPGYISDARFVNGSSVYTGNFTPPTAPLTAITNTSQLLNMANAQAIDSAAQSNMSLHGDANTSTDQAKFGDTSLHLDGTGDFSAGSDTSVGHFGAGNFTAECWVYPTASPNQPIIMGQWNGSYSWAIQMSNDSSRNLRFLTSSVGDQVSSTAVALNQWSHVALVRNGNTFNLYLNGTSVKNVTNSAALLASTDAFTIGNNAGGGQPFQGYIDEVRISKFARYTSNFTAPTEAFADKGQ